MASLRAAFFHVSEDVGGLLCLEIPKSCGMWAWSQDSGAPS